MNLPHPLESVFGLESGLDSELENDYEMTTLQEGGAVAPTGEQPVDHKDDDDKLIESRIDEVYAAAMSTFQQQTAYTEIIEPRYAARNAEVASNYLNIALAAANSRAKVKTDRKRANQSFVPYANGGKTTNNMIIASREEILKMVTIDMTPKEIK